MIIPIDVEEGFDKIQHPFVILKKSRQVRRRRALLRGKTFSFHHEM